METTFELATRRFLEAGNFIEGSPAKVAGKFSIPEMKSGSKIVFKNGCRITNCTFRFPQGGGTIVLGENTVIRLDAKVGQGALISIDDRTSLNRVCQFLAWEGKSIKIGKDCLLSNVKIRTSDMHPLYDWASGKRINHPQDVIVEAGVWIGENVTVTKGARVSTGTVIGAASLVNGKIPAHCIAAGTPARVKRKGVIWQRSFTTTPPPMPDSMKGQREKFNLLKFFSFRK